MREGKARATPEVMALLTVVTSAKARGAECALDTMTMACRSRPVASQAPVQGAAWR